MLYGYTREVREGERQRGGEGSEGGNGHLDAVLRPLRYPSPHPGKYVSRALTLFFGQDAPSVTIKAAERLMDRGLWVAEVVRRKVAGLHQILHIAEKKVVDVYEPTEEGLLTVRDERLLTVLEITLTRTPTPEQKKHPGYHAPLTNADFLTKETWQQGEKERAQRREGEGEREDRPRRDHQDRPRREN